MSPLGRPKKDKKNNVILVPKNHVGIIHLKVVNQIVQNFLKRNQHPRGPKEHSSPTGSKGIQYPGLHFFIVSSLK
jgi:hypothetical protein